MSPLASAFLSQATSCERLGSPFMARLCRLLAERLAPGGAVTDRLFAWQGDLSSNGHSVPLRLCGALHALKLGGDADLGAAYPPHTPDDAALWAAIARAFEAHSAFILAFLDSPPQTNEVRRSVAIIAAGHMLAGHFGLPIVARELGASAGLNLNWADYAIETAQGRIGASSPVLTLRPDWRGPLPAGPAPQVVQRRGVDLNPLDPQEDAPRLRAYLWPDQPERLSLTDAAIAAARPGAVVRGDAVAWLAEQLAPVPGHLRLIYHTIAWQYFPAAARSQGADLIVRAGAATSTESPLAWLSMEADAQGPGAALTLRLWPGNHPVALARVDFHGRWVIWQAGARLFG